MKVQEFTRLARRIMSHPAAAFHEHAVRGEVEKICAEHKLDCKRDAFGNVIVRLRTAPKMRPVALAAHMDHPGFDVVRKLDAKRWLARFLGGVPDSYFKRGIRLRLMPGGTAGKLGARRRKEKEFEIHASALPKV